MTATTNTVTTVDTGTLRLIDQLLNDRIGLREAINASNEGSQGSQALPSLLGITVGCFSFYGLVMAAVLRVTDTSVPLFDGTAHWLASLYAYPLGVVGALGICLPSYYFYALQCGFQPSLRRIVINSLAGQASTGLMLLGILPIYAAVVLGVALMGIDAETLNRVVAAGLLLPLVAGWHGVSEIRRAFEALEDTDPRPDRRRAVALLSLWSAALYLAVAPVLVYRLLALAS